MGGRPGGRLPSCLFASVAVDRACVHDSTTPFRRSFDFVSESVILLEPVTCVRKAIFEAALRSGGRGTGDGVVRSLYCFAGEREECTRDVPGYGGRFP